MRIPFIAKRSESEAKKIASLRRKVFGVCFAFASQFSQNCEFAELRKIAKAKPNWKKNLTSLWKHHPDRGIRFSKMRKKHYFSSGRSKTVKNVLFTRDSSSQQRCQKPWFQVKSQKRVFDFWLTQSKIEIVIFDFWRPIGFLTFHLCLACNVIDWHATLVCLNNRSNIWLALWKFSGVGYGWLHLSLSLRANTTFQYIPNCSSSFLSTL